MNRASQVLVGGGDREGDCNTNNDTRRAPIKFLDAEKGGLRTTIPRALVAHADGGGKHRQDLLRELAILWHRFVEDGEFRR
jgi:hypothetical protein